MKTFAFLIAIMIFTATNIFAQNVPPIEPGVSQALAKWRGKHYSDVRYKLNITLEKGAPLMKGEIEVSVKLTDEGAKNDLILDWRTTQFQNDKDKPFAEVLKVNESVVKETVANGVFDYQINKEHLIISQKYLKTGENVIKIAFASPIKTSGSAITRYVDKEDNAEYIYSLFVPSDASTAFPVFDQPDLKARFTVNIKAPNLWRVVSNAEKKDASIRPPNYAEDWQKGFFTSQFEETKPISTYVFAFAAGDFQYSAFFDSNDEKALPITIYYRKSQAKKMYDHLGDVYDLNSKGIKYLESYFDYKFPFPKYDLVLIPEFPFGGMEHAGATFLRESAVIFPNEPTKNDFVSRANLIFHEAAHQWFGDTVTMKWFDDLWLKEGFAEFMAYKTLAQVMPEYNAWKIFYERNKQLAYLTDSTKGTTPIYQEITNLSSAKSAYGNIVYRKAPSFLKQAEFYLGEKEFQTAVRAFLKKHEFKNAEWTDLVKEFETASKQDLKDWANAWVKQRGLSKVNMGCLDLEDVSNIYGLSCRPNQQNILSENGKWSVRFNILVVEKNGNRKTYTFETDKEEKEVVSSSEDLDLKNIEIKDSTKIAEVAKNVEFVFPNYQDYGYGIFLLDEQSRAYVLENIQSEKDDFLRTMMWGALWDSVREGELAPKDYVELVIKNINVEQDESTIQTLLNRVSTAMTYYLSDAQRKEIAPRLENLLLNKLAKATTSGQRITFYRALLNTASTDDTKKILKDIFNNNGKISLAVDVETKVEIDAIRLVEISLPLKTKDKFDIVAKLLTLNDADAPRMLAELEKTEKSDEARRYAYAAKAGIGSAENKLKFWNDFVSNKDISESWIEAAFVSFNSPKHSDLTLPYLEKALAELPNLKRNRKIFFVNGWLASFIGGQKSEEALKIVNKFLAENPNLDKDLRLKILENVDLIERAVKIRGK